MCYRYWRLGMLGVVFLWDNKHDKVSISSMEALVVNVTVAISRIASPCIIVMLWTCLMVVGAAFYLFLLLRAWLEVDLFHLCC